MLDLTTDEAVLSELEEFVSAGILQYVLPSIPLGEAWVLGHGGTILNFDGEQVRAWLLGATIVLNHVVLRDFNRALEGVRDV